MRSVIREISEKTTVYHRSRYPMKVGDVVVPHKDETGKHWLESKEAEIALEMYRQEHHPDKPSRVRCIYSAIIPRSRFVEKGILYAVQPKGKIHVADSGLIDMINDKYEREMYEQSGNWLEDFRQSIKEDPRKALHYLDYNLADQYWEGKTYRGTFKALKEDVEVLSDSAVVTEVIPDRLDDIKVGEIYEVTESDKLIAWLQPVEPKPDKIDVGVWKEFHEKVLQHLFSKIDPEKRMNDREK
jgi:hypothetical protein